MGKHRLEEKVRKALESPKGDPGPRATAESIAKLARKDGK